jgi:hypothetical protein
MAAVIDLSQARDVPPQNQPRITKGNGMAEMDAEDRDKLRKDQFAYVDSDGGEHLPINDESHVRNAIARFNQTDFESKTAKEEARKKIVRAAERHGIEVDEDSNVKQPVG